MRLLTKLLPVLTLVLVSSISACGVFSSGYNEALDMDWTLERLAAYPNRIEESMLPTMTLNEGDVTGSTGVNTFSGTYTWKSDGSFEFDTLTVTEIGGTPDQMEIERLLLNALDDVDSYEITNTVLILSDDEGNFLVSFNPAP